MRFVNSLIAVMMIWVATSCVTVPNVGYCLQDTARSKLHCSESMTGRDYELQYQESNRYICMSPQDYKKILDYIAEITEMAGLRAKNIRIENEQRISHE